MQAGEGGDICPDTKFLGLLAEEKAPLPSSDTNFWFDGIADHVHATLAEGNQRANVAVAKAVDGDSLKNGIGNLLRTVRQFAQAEDMSRRKQPVDVFGQTKHGGAVVSCIAANTLEHTGTVMQASTEEMNVRIRELHHLAVHPNVFWVSHR